MNFSQVEQAVLDAAEEVTPDNPNGVHWQDVPRGHRFLTRSEKEELRELYRIAINVRSIRVIKMNICLCSFRGLGHSWWKCSTAGTADEITYCVPHDFSVSRLRNMAKALGYNNIQ